MFVFVLKLFAMVCTGVSDMMGVMVVRESRHYLSASALLGVFERPHRLRMHTHDTRFAPKMRGELQLASNYVDPDLQPTSASLEINSL